VVYAYGNENFVGDNFQVICLQFFLYGLAVIPFTYCCSFLFSSHSTAQNVMILVYVVGGVMLTMVDFALSQIDSTRDANNQYIRHLFRLIPNFCLGDTIFWMSLRSILRMGKWDLDISGNDSIFLAWEAVVYFILAIAIDYLQNIPSFVALFKADPVVSNPEDSEPLDVDVAEYVISSIISNHISCHHHVFHSHSCCNQ
jgi:ATP-binding cassette subfamily A (ABC1) protein 3